MAQTRTTNMFNPDGTINLEWAIALEAEARENRAKAVKQAYNGTLEVLAGARDHIAKPIGRAIKKTFQGIGSAGLAIADIYSNARLYDEFSEKIDPAYKTRILESEAQARQAEDNLRKASDEALKATRKAEKTNTPEDKAEAEAKYQAEKVARNAYETARAKTSGGFFGKCLDYFARAQAIKTSNTIAKEIRNAGKEISDLEWFALSRGHPDKAKEFAKKGKEEKKYSVPLINFLTGEPVKDNDGNQRMIELEWKNLMEYINILQAFKKMEFDYQNWKANPFAYAGQPYGFPPGWNPNMDPRWQQQYQGNPNQYARPADPNTASNAGSASNANAEPEPKKK